MGSSGENGIDASEGGLVWVRRRNGSWWPGRIMGMHELKKNSLVSPRSGTPVKLLGRVDSSVDWYNLERSKRVKPFRCGEYDECIEKAKAFATNSNKKAVKYARREDAILHALELESARLGKEPLNLCSRSDTLGGETVGLAGESPIISRSGEDNEGVADDLSDFEDNSNSSLEFHQSEISLEEPIQNGSSKMQSLQGRRRRTPNDSEDDGTEGVKRMRGLEDLGIGVVSKTKVLAAGTPEISQQDGALGGNSNTGNCLVNGNFVNGGKGHSSTLKKKRSQVAHESLKRKNRSRTLTKVMESTAMVSVPAICDGLTSSISSPSRGVTYSSSPSALYSNELQEPSPLANHVSASTEPFSFNTFENGTSADIVEDVRETSQTNHTVKENEASGISGQIRTDFSDILFDVPFMKVEREERPMTDFSSLLASCSSGKPQVDASGQQSCHLRQSESLPARNESHNTGFTSSIADHNITDLRADIASSEWLSKGKRNSRHARKEALRTHVDMYDKSSTHLAGVESSGGYSQGGGQKAGWNVAGAPDASYNGTSRARSKPFAEGELGGFRDLRKCIKGTRDVKLLPDRSLTSQVSLPYRLSCFSMTPNHPMVDSPGRNSCSDGSLYNVKIEIKSSYRPQHVPLVSLASKLDGKAFIGHPLTVEVLPDGQSEDMMRIYGPGLEGGDTSGVVKPTIKRSKKLSQFSRTKSSKSKKSGLLNKKTRKLSSLTGKKKSEEEKVGKPVMACIPLSVVFSRINEAVSGHARPAHRALPTFNP